MFLLLVARLSASVRSSKHRPGLDKLFLGVAVERPTWIEASGAGTEDIGPEDTCDADYGRLLEAVQNRGKGLASPRGFIPFTVVGSVV